MLLRLKDVVHEYGLSASTLRNLMKDGKLTEYRTPGNQRRYDKAEIEGILTVEKE